MRGNFSMVDSIEAVDPLTVRFNLSIPYADLPGFPLTTVGSHAGRLLLGHVGPTPVAVLQGRAHYYERGKADEMRGAIHAVAELGCETLLQTNAAGSLRLDMPPGSVMAITDHINFAGINPLFGIGPGENSRFVDWVRPDAGAICCIRLKPSVFDAAAVAHFHEAQESAGVRTARGSWFGEEDRVFRLGFGLLAMPELDAALAALATALRRALPAAA